MDRIQKAIEKARNEHQKKPEFQVSSQNRDNKIVYTHTKSYEINNKTLFDRRIVALQKYHPVADVYKMLRTKVLRKMRENNWRSFAITAPTPEAGKTNVAVNLAIVMAMELNHTVLLVDMDLRFPKVNWYFGIEPEYGLIDFIKSDVPLEKILINPGLERLVVLPGQGSSRGSSELLSGPKVQMLVDEIRKKYKSRIIIYDMPPLLTSDDVIACNKYYDALLLVIEERGNKPEDITRSLEMLSDTNLLGTILNKSENPPEHQSY